jgi:hypothetical protein
MQMPDAMHSNVSPTGARLLQRTLGSGRTSVGYLARKRELRAGAPMNTEPIIERSPERVGLTEGLGRRFVLRPIALVIGRQAVAKVLPCFLLDR